MSIENQSTPSVELVKALDILGLNGDKIFSRIRYDLSRGLIKEARSHLNFVDVMLKQCANAEVSEGGSLTSTENSSDTRPSMH